MNIEMNENKLFNDVIKYLLIAFPIIIYFSFIQKYALNIPHWDDFDAILLFMNKFKVGTTGEKFALLFSQHNEHRIFSSRVVYVLYYYVFHTINFRYLIFINGVILLAVYLLLVHVARKMLPSLWYVAALALSICLFDLNNYENADFAMAGMQNYGIFFFFIYSMYFYSKKADFYLLFAILFQIICVFSSGNGAVASFFIVLFTFMNKNAWKRIFSTVVLLVTTPLYYISYHKGTSDFFTSDPAKFVPYFLHSLGAHFSFTLGVLAALVLLLLFVLVFPVTYGKNEKRFEIKPETPLFICLALFVFSSLGVMSIFRGNLPIEGSYASRYFIYTHTIVAIIFLFFLHKFQNKTSLNRITIGAMIILCFIYVKNHSDGASGFESFYNQMKAEGYDYPNASVAKEITDESCRLKIYCIEEARSKIK
jgi:hypothetical protein